MADGVLITAGAGTTIATDDAGAPGHVQIIKLAISADGSATVIPADAANGLDVDVTRVSGNVTVVQTVAANLKVEAVMAAGSAVVPVSDNAASLTVDAPAGTPVAVRLSDGTSFVAGAVDRTTAAAPASQRLSDGAAFCDAAKTGQLPTSLVNGRLDVNVGASAVISIQDGGNVISIDDGAGLISVDDGGGSLTVDGTVTANQGTAAAAANAWVVKVSDGTDTVGISTVGASKALKIDVVQDVGNVALADKAAFTEGTTKFNPAGGVFNDTIGSAPTEDQAAALRITQRRGLHINLRNDAGAEVGITGAPLRTDPTGTTTQPVSGTVTSNQGTANATPWNENLSQVGGTAVVTAAAGVQRVGIADEGNAAFSATNPLHVEPSGLGQTPVRKAATYSASQAAIAIWTPAAGKKFNIAALFITPTANGEVTIFDNTDADGNEIFEGTLTTSTPLFITFPVPHPSSTANNVLRYSTGAGAVGRIIVLGYEV